MKKKNNNVEMTELRQKLVVNTGLKSATPKTN